MKKRKVLVFPAGSEIAHEIFNALKYSKFVELYGGTSVDDHSTHIFKKVINDFPYCEDDDFIEYLNHVVEEYGIDCIYPAHDSVCVVLSNNIDRINTQVIVSDAYTTNTCRSKTALYNLLEGHEVTPFVYEYDDEITEFPVFIKPDCGQGGNGASIVKTREELEVRKRQDNKLVVCEYLPGNEYTIDCFTDLDKKLRIIKQRTRERIKAGIAVKSRSATINDSVEKIANILNDKLTFKGAWFFQVKQDVNGNLKLLEASPRIPGTMGLYRNKGINFPLLTLFLFWGYDVDIIENMYSIEVDRAFYSAYREDVDYKHVYLDFDDTIVIDDRVNELIMQFIYQSINDGKIIHLLSKHTTDIYKDLKKYRISEDVFSDIKVIKQNDDKANYIVEKDSIFIDDSFAERKLVHDKLGIPVFDLDMIEGLIDWRK